MKFNLEDYETVEERITRFYAANPNARIVTQEVTKEVDRAKGIWTVKAFLYLSDADQATDLPKATGYAFEVDGQGMANKTSALENCETSAIGRALANAGYSGNRRTSREEMEKVQRGVEVPRTTFEARMKEVKTKQDARDLWIQANREGAGKQVLAEIQALADSLD
jgi:prophage DNA circulation protein